MQKIIIISCLSGIAIVILGQFGFFNAIMLLLVAGVIPGTNYAIPSNTMFLLIMAMFASLIIRVAGKNLLHHARQLHKELSAFKPRVAKHLPKRRFTQI